MDTAGVSLVSSLIRCRAVPRDPERIMKDAMPDDLVDRQFIPTEIRAAEIK